MPRELRSVTTDYGTIAYSDTDPVAPERPTAVFVHGVFLNGHLWRHVIERMRDTRRCIAQIYATRHPQRLASLVLTNCDVHDNWPPVALAPTRELIEQGGFADFGRQMLEDLELARGAFSVGYENPQTLTAESRDIYLEPLLRSPEAVAGIERWFGTSHDNSQTVEIEPLLGTLDVPTLVVWGTGDVFFPVEWAHWLKRTVPGCREVIELPGARLFFPEERRDELASALRALWQRADQPARRRSQRQR